MESIQYYWVEGKEDLEIIEKLLADNEIHYEVKVEHIKFRMKEGIHQERKAVYLIFVDEMQLNFADEIILKQANSIVTTCTSKKIELKKEDKKRNKKQIIISILVTIGVILFLLLPIGLINDTEISVVLLMIKMGILILGTVYTAKTHSFAILTLIMTGCVGITNVSRVIFQKYTLDLLNSFNHIAQYYFFYFVLIMIVAIMFGAFYGLIKYKNNTLGNKLGYCAVLILSYVIIMITTIDGYANLYAGYNNEIFLKYAQSLGRVGYDVEEEFLSCTKETREETNSGYLLIKGKYHKQQGSTEIDVHPYKIIINVIVIIK